MIDPYPFRLLTLLKLLTPAVQSDDTKWDGLDKLDVGSKFMMFERAGEKDKEARHGSDRSVLINTS